MGHESTHSALEYAYSLGGFVSGLALVILAVAVQIVRSGIIRKEYEKAVGALIGAVGLHCIFASIGAPSLVRLCVDSVMTIISVTVCFVVCYDNFRESWHLLVSRFK